MEELTICEGRDIACMSYKPSREERIRLLNEIVFARGDEAIGGRSHTRDIMACKQAIEAIDEHLRYQSRNRHGRKAHLPIGFRHQLGEAKSGTNVQRQRKD